MASPDFTWLFIKMLAGLVLVLGLAVVLIRFVLPKTGLAGFRRGARGSRERWVHLLDRTPIEPGKNLYTVKIGARYFVLSSSEHAVNLIAELSQLEGEKIENS
jgi:flagellar biogenesis protein FliO